MSHSQKIAEMFKGGLSIKVIQRITRYSENKINNAIRRYVKPGGRKG